jgi:hypothetical protein
MEDFLRNIEYNDNENGGLLKMVKKYLRKILILWVVAMMVFSLVACRTPSNFVKHFDSEEELRQAATNLFFFDFDLQEMELLEARAFAFGNIFVGYEINYRFTSTKFGRIFLSVHCLNSSLSIAQQFIETIDDIECYVSYVGSTEEHFTIHIAFELENSSYTVAFEGETQGKNEQEIIDHFLDIARPAIENRSKY